MNALKLLFAILYFCLIITTSGFSQIFYVSGDSLWVQKSNDATPNFITKGTTNPIQAIVADTSSQTVYWAQGSQSIKIYKASFDSLNKELVADVSGSIQGLALDAKNGKLYGADLTNNGKIIRVSIDDGSIETIVAGDEGGSTDGTLGIDLDLANNKMYWVKFGAVMRANMDGSNIEKVVDIPDYIGQTQPLGITLDTLRGYVYWINSGTNQIERASTGGGQIESIIQTSTASALDIDMKNGWLYWVEDYIYTNEGGAIYRANLDGTEQQKLLETSYTRSALFVGDWEIATSIEDNVKSDLPNNITLSQNYPNPFNPTTVIQYELPQAMSVRLDVYNFLGQKVKNLISGELQSSGTHKVIFDAHNLASGIYFYQIETKDSRITRRMTLIK